MQDNKELFDYLNIKAGGARAKNIDAISAAVKSAAYAGGPSQKVIDNIMTAAYKEKSSAIKNVFAAFNYKTVLAGTLILALAVGVPLKMLSYEAVGTEIYSSAVDANFELLDADLEEILSGLDSITEVGV
ncbi:hypothetical protein AAIR98_000476 [Elusimicrobium simillimum]|uniref:hypothetical protein n=1 Tax=Elusimicrobium simillimum TaxID=3143438 RepID=UPI003C6FA5B3